MHTSCVKMESKVSQEAPSQPFYVFNPSMYTQEYFEKMRLLQKKKELKEKRTQKKQSRNVKSTFVVSGAKDNYDIDSVLQQLGEIRSDNKK